MNQLSNMTMNRRQVVTLGAGSMAALALAGGVAIGISIGIRLYSRYGRAGR